MNTISILGSGNMARGIGTRVLTSGNTVQILDRDSDRASALAADLGGDVTAGTTTQQPTGEIVVLAVPYEAAVALVTDYGKQLDGKIIVDITNPVDFASFDRLVTPENSSAAEEIAAVAVGGSPVVKAFNTTFAPTLVSGQVAGQPLDVLIASDSDGAKSTITELVRSSGLNPIDAGPLRRARQLEHTGFLHMTLQQPLGTNFQSALRFLS